MSESSGPPSGSSGSSGPPEEGLGTRAGVGDLLDVLSSPLGSDDELNAVLTRRPRAKVPSLTLVLAVIAVAGAGFIGGIMVGKHYGSSGSGALASALSRLGAAREGAAGGAGTAPGGGTRILAGGGAGGAAGNATVGTIKLVDHSTVYVQTLQGDIVPVSTSTATKVTASVAVPVSKLEPGEFVIVVGSKNSSGTVSAVSISQTSLGGGAVPGGGAGG